MQFIVNNQVVTVEQPDNAFVGLNPVKLGNYTFNDHVYGEMTSTRIYSTDRNLGLIAGESNRIITYEIMLTPNNNTTLQDTPKANLIVLSNLSTMSRPCKSFSCRYTVNDSAEKTVNTTKTTYITAVNDIIEQINKAENTFISTALVNLVNDRSILRVDTPVKLSLQFTDPLEYSNGYIYYTSDLGTTGSTIVTTPINAIYSGQSIVSWCTLNDQNGVLAITTTTPCDISVQEVSSIIK